MNTSVLFLKKPSIGSKTTLNENGLMVNASQMGATCSEYIKSNTYSSYYTEIFAFHPKTTRFEIDKNSYKIIDMINYFFSGWFTITILEGKSMKFYADYISKNTSVSVPKFGFHIHLHNKGVKKKSKQFNQLLFPLTLSRWSLVNSEYTETRKKILEVMEHYPIESLYLPAIMQFGDFFHNYYRICFFGHPMYYDPETFFDSMRTSFAIAGVEAILGQQWEHLKSNVKGEGFRKVSAYLKNAYMQASLPLSIGADIPHSARKKIDALSLYNQLAENLYNLNSKAKLTAAAFNAESRATNGAFSALNKVLSN